MNPSRTSGHRQEFHRRRSHSAPAESSQQIPGGQHRHGARSAQSTAELVSCHVSDDKRLKSEDFQGWNL